MAGSGGLAALLELERLEDDLFRSASPHVTGAARRVFGGQVAAQALVAAGNTVVHGSLHSLHSYFLRPGDLDVPIVFSVDRIRNGRSFTTRRVVAVQHGEAIFNLQCSFHDDEPGPEHAAAAPAVPAPEHLEDARIVPPSWGHHLLPESLLDLLELRYVSEIPWRRSAPAQRQQLWLRVSAPLGDGALEHAAALVFASDVSLLDAALQPHGQSASDDRFSGASLDHCMWFHRPARADTWLLYDQASPSASRARGLSIGALTTRAGLLVATVAQEGLLRFAPSAPPAAVPAVPGAGRDEPSSPAWPSGG